VHTVNPVEDRTQIGYSSCLEPQLHVPGLEISFRSMSVIGLHVASLSPFGLEARSNLVMMLIWS
jgi:hypothetical protein